MHESMVVFRRELKSYFLSPIGYVFGIPLLTLLLYFTTGSIFANGSLASVKDMFEMVPVMLIVFASALTMRLWAEERKLGTLELLMTFPVTIGQLVFGKFLAGVVYLGLMLLLTVGLPLTVGAYGKLDWMPVLGSYVASMLFAGSFIAVGMFWSSVTRDQIIALLLSVLSLLALYLTGYPVIIEYASGWMPAWLVDVINGISPYKYFVSIARGVFDTRDFVYFACFCGFFLYANTLVLHSRRQKG